MDDSKYIEVGELTEEIVKAVGSNLPLQKIYRSFGLPAHLIKQKHFNCLKHIDLIPEIIKNPDYIGVNPNENGESLELIKVLDRNVLIGIKLDIDENYLYVSTMHDVQESKIQRRLHSGRIKQVSVDNTDD